MVGGDGHQPAVIAGLDRLDPAIPITRHGDGKVADVLARLFI
jgi:hypothetical protein